MKTVLISGATGFVGSHLITSLGRKFKLFALYRKEVLSVHNSNITWINSDELHYLTEQIDVVVMCHAYITKEENEFERKKLKEANEEFTLGVAKKFQSSYLIFLSSVSVYGHTDMELSESSPCKPTSSYGQSKANAEKLLRNFDHVGILRTSSIFGKGMKKDTLLPIWVDQALAKGELKIWGDGNRLQNYISVEELCSYIESMIDHQPTGTFLAVNQEEISNQQLAMWIAAATNSQIYHEGTDNSPSFRYQNLNTINTFAHQPFKDTKERIKAYIQWRKKQS